MIFYSLCFLTQFWFYQKWDLNVTYFQSVWFWIKRFLFFKTINRAQYYWWSIVKIERKKSVEESVQSINGKRGITLRLRRRRWYAGATNLLLDSSGAVISSSPRHYRCPSRQSNWNAETRKVKPWDDYSFTVSGRRRWTFVSYAAAGRWIGGFYWEKAAKCWFG